MSTNSPTNNGATLEDCHSNFFALTDLCGIKWRRLAWDGVIGPGHPHHAIGPLDDPVLSSFSRCLAADILCVWRKLPNAKTGPPSTPNDPFHTPTHSSGPPQFNGPPGNMMPMAPHHMNHPHMNMMGPGHIPPPMGGNSPFPSHNMHQQQHGLLPSQQMNHNQFPSTPTQSFNVPKELWLFWYGEDPDFTSLVHPQLLKTEPDQGSWENGLSYECRSLLFKALHNLIERCLLARDFVRIGKWFIQPCDDNQRLTLKSFPIQLTFSFSFFVHGESTVCMSVDVRQHPPVRRITKQHLLACQTPNFTMPVILAPHGLAGTLTGVGYRMNEQGTFKILEEWKHFYPVEAALRNPIYDTTTTPSGAPQSSPNLGHSSSTSVPSSSGMAPVVEVLVAGVKMRYPSCYVLSTDMDEPPKLPLENRANYSSPTGFAPKSRSGVTTDSESAACPSNLYPSKPQGTSGPAQEVENVRCLLPERVWQECMLCSSKGNNDQNNSSNNNSQSQGPGTPGNGSVSSLESAHWEFTDPTKKTNCLCAGKSRRLHGGSRMSSHSSKSSTKLKRSTFHKRNTQQQSQAEGWPKIWDIMNDDSSNQCSNAHLTNTDFKQIKNDPLNPNNHQPPNTRGSGAPPTPLGEPPTYKTGPGSTAPSGVGNDIHGTSPASIIAPSPVPTPRSQQPSSVQPHEHSIPSISPQPVDVKFNVSPEASVLKSGSNLPQTFSPLVNCYETNIKTEPPEHGNSNNDISNAFKPRTRQPGENSAMTHPNQKQKLKRGLQRPTLPSKEYESLLAEEHQSHPSDLIYDYTALEAWMQMSTKKAKSIESKIPKANIYSWGLGMKNVPESARNYDGYNHRADDPYEFDDENHSSAHSVEGGKPKEERSKDEGRSTHLTMLERERENIPIERKGDLFTSQGLQPHYSDLDQIFDNSDSSGDEALQVPTPPGSNKPLGSDENGITSIKQHKSNLGILRPEELSKMFPTPPSHEHNPISSPCGLPDTPLMETVGDSLSCLRRPQDNYTGIGSPPDEPTDVRMDSTIFLKNGNQTSALKSLSSDWSFVYKAPAISKMLGSSKYAPISLLPSQQLPPISILNNATYKPAWQFPPQPQQRATGNPQQHQHPASSVHHPPMPHHPHPMVMGPGSSIQPPVHLRPGLSPISPGPNSMRGPTPFDLGSPPGSMYLKQGPVIPHQQFQHGAHGPMLHQGHHMTPFGPRGFEAHALVVNLSLSDSVINLFRDHNFDSCTMCVCNAGNRVVGNIRGSEVGVYIPDYKPEEDTVRCNCGFSASVNRRLAHRAGLFYEDEFEITTAALANIVLLNDEWYEKKKPSFMSLDPKYPTPAALANDKDAIAASNVLDNVPPYLLEMLREQCLLLFGSTAASRFTGEVLHHRWTERTYNFLEYLDGNRSAVTALEHGRSIMLEASNRNPYPRMPEDNMAIKANCMHKWPYLWARGAQSSQEIMQVMKALLPLLQEAVHAKAWDAQYNVSGPLTWRQFHRLAGRGTDDRCEPQPIPSVLVGSEKDWVALSPLAIKFWEKLLLEPFAYPRDVAYIVVAPDNDYVLQKVRIFFRELSSMYEVCQLGRHCPISDVLRDGILRVGKTAALKLASEPMDEWFAHLPDTPATATLKLYAQVCKCYLAPQLANISLDQSILDNPSQSSRSSSERMAPSPKMPPPPADPANTPTTNPNQGPLTPKNEYDTSEYGTKEGVTHDPVDDDREPPAIVIYLVEPFGFGSDNKDLHRMATLGLLRCFANVLNLVPENIKNNITLQIISLEDVMNIGSGTMDKCSKNDQMRALSLSVYSQCRRVLAHQSTVKSLTGFGPAAAAELFLKTKEGKRKETYRLYTPPFVLAPIKEKISEGVDWLGSLQSVGGMVSSGNSSLGPIVPQSSSVLYVAYCISEDHRWLLATATDDRGELVETTTISVYVPHRSKRRKASARKHGLGKLMDFILGIMSNGIQPWRLVVGRLGRIGHGELESWSTLLSRKSLLRASNQLKDACRQCSLQYPVDTPCVLSACLVSLEPDSCLRLMPDQFTPDERFGVTATAAPGSGSTSLSTPHDVSCSHILVFPTSATTQSSQTAFQEQHINCTDMGDEDLLFMNDTMNDDITDGMDGIQDLQLQDIFSWADTGPGASSPVSSPRRDSASQPGSPGIGASGRQSPFQGTGQARAGTRGDVSDELGTLLQQPLALGYLVSTAPAGNLPPWFWASCPQRANEKGSGVFLKSALHLHSHSVLHNLDDLLQQQSNAKQHPLDSQFTTDVLRFVLEGYNALSWLCLDPKSHDRKSCLPVHIQKLLQLYYTISTLV